MVFPFRLAACVIGYAMMGSAAPQSGRELYEKYCIACHGRDGAGAHGGADLRDALKYGADLKSVSKVIKHGVPGNGMPSFADRTPSEIQKLAQYVLQLHKQGKSKIAKTAK